MTTKVVILMGVSGCGKTTVGQLFADKVGWAFEEGDRWHPPRNVEKMRTGTPLVDEDRWPWLDALSRAIGDWITADRRTVLACSALKQAYRDRLERGRSNIAFAWLKGSPELIADRIARRRHAYMPPALLPSQFATLEEPQGVAVLDIALPPEQLVDTLRRALGV